MENIFKALSKEYNAVKDKQDEDLIEKKELLVEVVDYVNSMKWLSRTPVKKKITFFIKSGAHGKPLQCSCLENPMDRGTWQAAVHKDHREFGHN